MVEACAFKGLGVQFMDFLIGFDLNVCFFCGWGDFLRGVDVVMDLSLWGKYYQHYIFNTMPLKVFTMTLHYIQYMYFHNK